MIIDGQFWAGLAFLALLTISPGQDMALIAATAVRHGRGAAFAATLGIVSGLAVHATASALGLSVILATSAELFAVVKLLGAIYLAYLGLRLIFSKSEPSETTRPNGTTRLPRAFFVRGAISNVLNPKVALFYLTFLPQFIAPGEPVLAKSLLFAAAQAAMGVVWLTAYAYGMTFIASRIVRLRSLIERIFGAALIGLGVRLALERR